MEWMVCIKGDDFDLRKLLKSLTSPELFLSKEESEYYLKSTSFDQLKNANEVREKAEELLLFINGAAKIALGKREPIKIDSIISIADDGKRKRTFFELGLELPFAFTFEAIVNGVVQVVQEVNQTTPIPNWVKLAQTDENVAKVLRLLENFGYDWVNLCRILEIVVNDVRGTSNIENKGWAKKDLIDRLTGTANNPDLSGDSSRHGIQKKGKKPPKSPMTLSEAESLVKNILRN